MLPVVVSVHLWVPTGVRLVVEKYPAPLPVVGGGGDVVHVRVAPVAPPPQLWSTTNDAWFSHLFCVRVVAAFSNESV